MLIKSRNFTPNKCELDYNQGGGLGWAPDQVKKFEGVEQRNSVRYEKNYSRMTGTCDKCQSYKDVNKTDGTHCKLRKCNV